MAVPFTNILPRTVISLIHFCPRVDISQAQYIPGAIVVQSLRDYPVLHNPLLEYVSEMIHFAMPKSPERAQQQ